MTNWRTVPDNAMTLTGPLGAETDYRIVWADEEGRDVAYVVSTATDRGNANARSIAAAPALLHACRYALYQLPNTEQREIVRKAIAAAGKQP